MKDPRRFIKEAISHDKVLDEALGSYAEHGEPEFLASAIDLSARVYSALIAEARRRKVTHISKPPKPKAR